MRGKIEVIWKLRDSPSRLISVGAAAVDWPSIVMVADVSRKRPLIRLNSVSCRRRWGR